jgi:putative peptide zinc metalloprotease protein
VPVRAGGVELLGEHPGSGYRQPQALVRRADGQTIQLTRLLYLILEAADGQRDHAQIAEVVGAEIGRLVSADDVRLLIESKLRPLGVLRTADGTDPRVRPVNPLLALRLRYVVSDPAMTRRITAPFATLFRAPILLSVVAAFIAVSGWVLFTKGLASATRQAFDQPGLLLVVLAVTVLSAGFHEFGHAAACRYGGATPGAMGTGLYLVWPAFYTDVSDSYRLNRAGRVRVDLGGLYFNAIFAVGMFAVWAATGWDAILLIIAAQLLQMLRQLAPIVRADGYHILADLTGVPDLYSRIKPTLLGLLPNRWGSAESTVLKPWARVIVTAWVLTVVPLLLVVSVLMVLSLPRVAATAWASLGYQWRGLGVSLDRGDIAAAGVRMLSVLAIALPLLGMGLTVMRLVRGTTGKFWRATEGRPVRRSLAVVLAVAVVAILIRVWWPSEGRYAPIQADERGTVVDGLRAARHTPVGPGNGSGLRNGQVVKAATSVWAAGSPPPSREHPRLALVLVPRPGNGAQPSNGSADGTAAAWVFPFDPPKAPGSGDNQALAVNTEDGATRYDVAFALVWATDGTVLNRNEAYALASCQGCRTVAVAFQVVLVVGQANIVVPQNISAAVNYSCVDCVTFAVAQQLVLTIPHALSAEAMARLATLWEQIQAFAAGIEDVPLTQLQAELGKFQSAIVEVIRTDLGLAPSAGAGLSAGPSSGPPGGPAGISPGGLVSSQSGGPASSQSGGPDPAEPASDATAPATPSRAPEPTPAPQPPTPSDPAPAPAGTAGVTTPPAG